MELRSREWDEAGVKWFPVNSPGSVSKRNKEYNDLEFL